MGRAFATAAKPRFPISGTTPRRRLRNGYFLANGVLDNLKINNRRGAFTSTVPGARLGEDTEESEATKNVAAAADIESAPTPKDLPHRRRQRERREAAASNGEKPLPPDASSLLTTQASQLPTDSLRRTLSVLLSLTKPRLSFLVVLTTTSAYSLYPVPALLNPALMHTPSLSTLTLLFLTTGTALSSASANAFNMLYEPKWDAMMSRTKNRPLVRGLISTKGALLFAVASGVGGVMALYYGVNPTVAFLGALNIVLYAGVYTPMKRISAVNTWVGAVVGGIPPLMGWAAAAGQTATGNGDWKELLFSDQSVGGWILAALLFAWQFPHFMALSWPIRDEYKNAGYRMLAWTNPARNGRVALRYSAAFFPICIALCYAGVTNWSFAITSVPINAWLTREAYKFWKHEGYKGTARGLFWASVWHLPVVMVLAMLEKKGMLGRVWRAIVGESYEDEDEWEEEDDEILPSMSPTEIQTQSSEVGSV
jgi:protoheme IX farnesyltransferase